MKFSKFLCLERDCNAQYPQYYFPGSTFLQIDIS